VRITVSSAVNASSSAAVETPKSVGAAAVKTAAARYFPVLAAVPIATVADAPRVADALMMPYANA